MYVYICINTHLCLNENWELLQQSLSDTTMAQSHEKMTREKNSVRLGSKRGKCESSQLPEAQTKQEGPAQNLT